MANKLGADILIQAPYPDDQPPWRAHRFVHRARPALGPVLEVTVANVEQAKLRLVENGCEIVKDEPELPRCYLKDSFGLIYNLRS
jgi:hypothetical protein